MAGFTWGGSSGATWGGPNGSTWSIGEPSPPEDLSVSVVGEREIDLSWSIVGSPDEIWIYRAFDESGTPGTWSQVDAVTYPTESYTDDDQALLDDERYHYRVTAVNAIGESEPSAESLSGRLPLPAVTDLAVDSISGRYATLSWTDPSNNADGYRLLLKTPSDSSYSQDGSDYDPVNEGETKTVTTTELLDGQQYDATVETFTENTTTREDQ